MKNTLYHSLLSRLKNKHSKLSNRFHKSVTDGDFQKQRYRKRRDSIERLKSLEKRINGLCGEAGLSSGLNYKHWAVALALGVVVAASNPAQAQTVQLSSPTIIGNAYANQILTGDLDNDGDLDAIYLSYFDDPVIMLNQGGFTFSKSYLGNTAGIVRFSVLADMDTDGDLDIFMQNAYPVSTFQVWNNDGSGNFNSLPATLPSLEFRDDKFFVGDVDGDGDADFVIEEKLTVTPNTQIPSVLKSSYALDGSFNFVSDPLTMPNGAIEGYLVALSDVDLDGDLDISFTGYNGGSSYGYALMAFQNDGLGAFSYVTGVYTDISSKSSFSNDADTLDIDMDGDADIINEVTGAYPTAQFRLYANDGVGVFTNTRHNIFGLPDNQEVNDIFPTDSDQNSDGRREFVVNTNADSTFLINGGATLDSFEILERQLGTAVPGDLDNNGSADLFIVKDGKLSVQENSGGFIPASDVLNISAIYDVDTVDIDNDSDLDLITASESLPSRVWQNDGFGNFTVVQEMGGRANQQAFGDFDGDGDMDLVRTLNGDNVQPLPGIEIWENTGGTFSFVTAIGYSSWEAKDIFVENIDGDGDLDILVYAEGSSKYVIPYINVSTGPGDFTTSIGSNIDFGYQSQDAIGVADIDGDGDVDLMANQGNLANIYFNDGVGVFSYYGEVNTSTTNTVTSLTFAHLDSDGNLDLVASAYQEHLVHLGNGDGTFQSPITVSTAKPYSSFVGDIDGDGDNDIIIGGYASIPTILLSDGSGTTFVEDTPNPITAYADEYTKVVLADVDSDGDKDVVMGGYYSGLKVFFNQAAAPGPEINVLGNGTDIVSGDSTPDAADHTDIGSVIIGETGSSTFTIQNTGSADLTISDITITGADASEFAFGGAIPNIINGGSSNTFTIDFNPTTVGIKSADIQILNDDSDEGTYTFSISGTALAEPEINVVGDGDIDILTGDITPDLADGTDFSSVVLGNSVTKTFKIQNTGSADLNVASIALSGAEATDFSISGLIVPAVIGIALEATFDVTYNPTTVGTSSATLTISNDDADEDTYTFDVAGTAISPEINVTGNGEDVLSGDVTPEVLDGTDFGTRIIGDTPTKSTFIVENLGDSDLNINSILLSGTGNGAYALTTDVTPFVIAVGGTSSIEVDFDPTTSGVADAFVDIVSDDLDESLYSFAITGVGQLAQEINVQGNGIDIISGDNTPDITDGTSFGSITVGQQATSQFEIKNDGETDLIVSDIQITGANASDFVLSPIGLPNTIVGGASVLVDVTYTASVLGASVASLEITSDDADEGVYAFEISGSGKAAGIVASDSLALVAIYNATGGASWTNNTNWLVDGQRAETWHGVEIVGDRVGKLFLQSNNLSGTIPPEIGDLTALTDMYMGNNLLTGAIPAEISNTSLDTLSLSRNELTSIPDELYNLTDLLRLSISQNDLEGTISPSIANLTNLNFIALWDNPFTGGTIPEEFWSIETLQHVFLGTSNIGGDISSFTNLTGLVEFWVDNSNVTGTVSSDIGNLSMLERLDISDNQMTGVIPAEVATLDSLALIEIQNNSFTELPDLSGLTKLATLDVSGNLFDFADLEPNAGVSGLVYNPQNTELALTVSYNGNDPFAAVDTVARAGSQVSITAQMGDALNNLYDWRLNGSIVSEQTAIIYDIPSMGIDDVGSYELTLGNQLLPDLEFTVDPFELKANAVITINAVEESEGTTPIAGNINAYLFSLNEEVADTIEFAGNPNFDVSSNSYSFPEVLLGEYLIAVEPTTPFLDGEGKQIPGAYIPSYYGDAFLSENANTLVLLSDSIVSIEMQQIPLVVDQGVGVVDGTMEEDFPEETGGRIDARRRAKSRKCGLRRRVTGGRINDDQYELIAYGETNEKGEFEFGFLPQGTYRFFVEYPGIPLDESAFVEFVIGENGISDDQFTLAVFASPDGISIEFVLGTTADYFTDFSIYPNPATDLINIEYTDIKNDEVIMEIVSMEGRVLHSKQLNRLKGKEQFDTTILKPGQYFVRFRSTEGKDPLVYKIIKK